MKEPKDQQHACDPGAGAHTAGHNATDDTP